MKWRWTFLTSLLVSIPWLGAEPIRIEPPADPEGDATAIIAEAVERAIATGSARLELAPGTYNIFPAEAREQFVWVSNNDPGLRRTAFPLWGAHNLEIDGHGARLVMHGLGMMAFMIYDCENVTIRDVVVDWNQPLFAQATVLSVDPKDDSCEVEFLPACHAHLRDGQLVFGAGAKADQVQAFWQIRPEDGWRQNLQWTHWIDPETRQPLPAERQLPLQAFNPWNARLNRPAEVEQTGPNRFRLRHGFTPLPAAGTAFVAKGMLRPNRTSPAVHIARSRGVTIEDLVVHQAGGMGLIAESSEDIVLRRYQVRLPADSPRLVTTTADGSHFSQCRGRILVEDCYFENMLDDAINVHGVYAIVDGSLGDDRVAIRLSHFEQLGLDYVRPGERIRFCSQETLLPYAERVVRSVRRINERRLEIAFTQPVRSVLQARSVVDNADRQPDLVFRGNTVRHNRGRGVLVTTDGHVLIENNTFDRPGGGGMGVTILLEGDAYVWHESGAVRDVTIRHNTFVPLNPGKPVIWISPRQPGVSEVQPPYHRNVRIEHNVFRVAGPQLLFANRVAGLRFVENTVTRADSAARSAAPAAPSFVLRASEDVTIAGNRFDLPRAATIQQVTPTTGLVVENNAGLAVP